MSGIWIILLYVGIDLLFSAFSGYSNVAYLAHILGYASGVLLALGALRTGLLKVEKHERRLSLSQQLARRRRR